MGQQVRRWLSQRDLVMVGDSSFAVLELLASLSQLAHSVHLVSRLRLDAALAYSRNFGTDPSSPPTWSTVAQRSTSLDSRNGGERPLDGLVNCRDETWVRSYGALPRTATGTAVWYHTGKPVVPLCWVLVRDPKGPFDPQAFLCNDLTVPPAQILLWFRQRWQVEVTFEQVRCSPRRRDATAMVSVGHLTHDSGSG
ncbi:MAG: hypothetical protein ACFBSF_18585 [Leptolyngbyaceae cyanobacterium]